MNLGRACSLDETNRNLICQALPCFGDAFVRKAVERLPSVDERKKTRLVYCIARTGWDSVPCLVQLLEDPSPNVRAAACIGLIDIIDPVDGEVLPEILQLRKGFLCSPSVSQEELETFLEKEKAIWDSPHTEVSINAEVAPGLLKRLEDDYQSVRLAAVGMLGALLYCCKIEVSSQEAIGAALIQKLEDGCQSVRIAAMHVLALRKLQEAPPGVHDSGLYDRLFNSKDQEACLRARTELACNGVLECLRRLLNDPSPNVQEKAGQAIAFCKTGEDLRALTRQEVNSLLQVLHDADPACQGEAVVRQEATYSLQWLAEQWEI